MSDGRKVPSATHESHVVQVAFRGLALYEFHVRCASMLILCAAVLSVVPGLREVADWMVEDHIGHADEAPIHVCDGDCHSSSIDNLAPSVEPPPIPVVFVSSACSVRFSNDDAAVRGGVTFLVERPPAS